MNNNWEDSAKSTMEKLLQLEENWNSYDSAPVDPEKAEAALSLLKSWLPEQSKDPWIVPTALGGVQVEAHDDNNNRSIEIEFIHDDKERDTIMIEVLLRVPVGDTEMEDSIGDQLNKILNS